jgi:hypothetical protein
MLRGVWGAALRDVDEAAYDQVFAGTTSRTGRPEYIVRPSAPDPADFPAVDWILFGEAFERRAALFRAWEEAAARGLGPRRIPFSVRRVRTYRPNGEVGEGNACRSWFLDACESFLNAEEPCILVFDAPLRLLRRKRLVREPTVVDLAVAALRRLRPLLRPGSQVALDELGPLALETARQTAARAWRGRRVDLHRWSGRQKRELELRGVAGTLALPEGPGQLSLLFDAATWLHLGKATTVGLGRLTMTSLPE